MVFIIKDIINEMIKGHTIDSDGYWIIDDDKLYDLIFQKLENENIYDIKLFVNTFGFFKAIEAYKEDKKSFIIKPNFNDNYKELACIILCSSIMKKSPDNEIEKDDTYKEKQAKKYAVNKDKINEKRRAKYLNDKLKKQDKLIF
jgi:hypothetical protein